MSPIGPISSSLDITPHKFISGVLCVRILIENGFIR